MSLELVLKEKTIKNRNALLSNYLQNNDEGVLDEGEGSWFKHIFQQFYTPDENETKFNISQISNVAIVKGKQFGTKCFAVIVDNCLVPTSIKRLSGGSRNDKANVIRSLRNAIHSQIISFRSCNKLNPTDVCPVTNKLLGEDAEVDHQIPFHILSEEWMENNINVSCVYNFDKFDYILQEPYYTSWYNFHSEKAILRWVSKEGNKFAHTLHKENDS